jgi:hypothetical protein
VLVFFSFGQGNLEKLLAKAESAQKSCIFFGVMSVVSTMVSVRQTPKVVADVATMVPTQSRSSSMLSSTGTTRAASKPLSFVYMVMLCFWPPAD